MLPTYLLWMQAAQATVQGKSKRLPQGRKYLNALKTEPMALTMKTQKHPADAAVT